MLERKDDTMTLWKNELACRAGILRRRVSSHFEKNLVRDCWALVSYPRICYKRAAVFRLLTIAFLTLSGSPLFAGIVLDGSFGTSGALPGPNYMIQASFGKTVGNNLFHSFNQFNLINTESATFTGPATIQNI